MDIQTINGKEYVSKEEYDELKNQNYEIGGLKETLKDPAKVLAFGKVKLSGRFVKTRVSIDYLKNVVDSLEKLTNNINGSESVILAFGNDYPVILGLKSDDEEEIIGFVIAPRKEE